MTNIQLVLCFQGAMAPRTHSTQSEVWRVFGRLEGVQTQVEVVTAIGVAQSVISIIWNRFLKAGRRSGKGRTRAATPNEDHYLTITARRHRNMNATLLRQHHHSPTGTTISAQTVQNIFHTVDLYVRGQMVCVKIPTSHHRARRNGR